MSYPFKMKHPLDSSEGDEFNPVNSFLFSNKEKKKQLKVNKKSKKKNK